MLTTREALERAIKIAGEAQREWDAAPEGMRAGKILMALSGHAPGYRSDVDEIHDALAAAKRALPGT
jgi:hypothetical protein